LKISDTTSDVDVYPMNKEQFATLFTFAVYRKIPLILRGNAFSDYGDVQPIHERRISKN
jgi:hypothetical protein